MCTCCHASTLSTGTYQADFLTPSGKLLRLTSVTFNVLDCELGPSFSGPSLSNLLHAYKVLTLSGLVRIAVFTVQAAVSDVFIHASLSPFQFYRLNDNPRTAMEDRFFLLSSWRIAFSDARYLRNSAAFLS
jgi:hypothetical protein